MKGRKALPRAIKETKGTLQNCREVENEAEPIGEIGDPPDWFNEEHKEHWYDCIKGAPLGLLGEAERGIMISYVSAAIQIKEAIQDIQERGTLVEDSHGDVKENPACRAHNRQILAHVRLAAEMGLTPSSRNRISVSSDIKKKSNPFSGSEKIRVIK